MTFQQAIDNHASVDLANEENSVHTESLWNACTGTDLDLDAHSVAVLETMPDELAQLMSHGGTPAAFAFDEHYRRTPGGHKTPFEVRQGARDGWAVVLKRSERAKPLMEGLGMDDSAAWAHTEKTPAYYTDSVTEIAELAGRMYSALKSTRANQATSAPEEIYSVELGAELPRLLPCELAHLGQPTEITLIERLADKRALQYAVRGEESVTRGPLVILLDESGSMRYQNPHRNIWAKAATITISRIAMEDDRPVSIVHYSTSCAVQQICCATDLFQMTQQFLGGGTNIPKALKRGVQELYALAKAGHKGADMVLITDGAVNDLENRAKQYKGALDAAEEMGSRLWTVAIECEHEPEAPFRARAEKYVHLSSKDMKKGEVLAIQGCVNPK